MATAAEGRRRRRNRSKKTKKTGAATTTTTVTDLPEHIFERVLLRLGPSPWLVRAAAVCRRWCRVVADAGFLARLRLAHPRATRIGDYHCDEYETGYGKKGRSPVFVPSSSATAIDGRRLALDFLPRGFGELRDSRGGLLLLVKVTPRGRSRSLDLLVCEPLTRRHQGILWPPSLDTFFLGAFLVDSVDAGRRISVSNFRILAAVNENLACVFSSGSDGGWRPVRTTAARVGVQPSFRFNEMVGRANNSIYWAIKGTTTVLTLDETTMEFSVVKFPENIWGLYNEEECASRVIGGEDRALRIVRLMSNELKIFAQRRHLGCGGEGGEWVLEKHLSLPEATLGLPGREEVFFQKGSMIVCANSKYILLTPILTNGGLTWLFSVELDAMRVEREHDRNKYNGEAYPFELTWPPVLPDTLYSSETR